MSPALTDFVIGRPMFRLYFWIYKTEEDILASDLCKVMMRRLRVVREAAIDGGRQKQTTIYLKLGSYNTESIEQQHASYSIVIHSPRSKS